jgi:predicted DNA-binding transcriptional regulator AlpA
MIELTEVISVTGLSRSGIYLLIKKGNARLRSSCRPDLLAGFGEK